MSVLDRAPAVSPAAYRRITRAALWSLVFIVVTGAGVRLTGSGLGCSSWPGCEPGELTPHGASGWNPWIEFVNRLITGAVSVAVALAVLGSLRRVPRRRDLTLLSWGLVAGVIGQIVLGAVVVRLHVHPIAVQGHFLLSAVLVANATVLHHRAARGDDAEDGPAPVRPLVDPGLARLTGLAVVGAAVVMLAGTLVTGSGPHAGDETAERLSFSVRGVAMVHSGLTWAFLALVVVLAVQARRARAPEIVTDRVQALLTAIVLQGAIGYVQYATGVPELLVGLHVLGSMVVWITAIRLRLTAVEPIEPVEPVDSSGRRPAGTAETVTATT